MKDVDSSGEIKGREIGGFPRLPNEDQAFLEGQSNEVGELAKLERFINQLDREDLGRAIVVLRKDSEESYRKELEGYILPIDERTHIIIMVDGSMMVIGPNQQNEDGIRKYQLTFSPNEAPLEFRALESIPSILDKLARAPSYEENSQVLLRNDNPEQLPKLYEYMDKALKTTQELKTLREQAKRESVPEFNSRVSKLFNPGTPVNPKPQENLNPGDTGPESPQPPSSPSQQI